MVLVVLYGYNLESRLVGEKPVEHKDMNYTPEFQCENIAEVIRYHDFKASL